MFLLGLAWFQFFEPQFLRFPDSWRALWGSPGGLQQRAGEQQSSESRADIFPFSAAHSVLAALGRRDHLVSPQPLKALIESELPADRASAAVSTGWERV
jgi:hypothetical protein